MRTELPDGRIFETQEFLKIEFDPNEPVYKYKFFTVDRKVVSSARHSWVVWDKEIQNLAMIKMSDVDIDKHMLLIQSFKG